MSTRHSFLSTTGLVRPLQLPKRPFISTAATVNVSKPETPSRRSQVLNTARARLASIAAVNVLVICALLSFLFIGSLSFAFIGGAEVASFKDLLDDIEKNEPGLVLLGEDVDVDIDEPSVTIRWSLIACGEAYFLPGSQGIHGSSGCGVPNMTVDIFVDGDEDAAFKYDPANIPLASTNGARHGIQDLTRFDSDHVLDVHEALLYPFDDYAFTTTLYAEDPGSESPITIQKLHTVNTEISFNIKSEDMQTYSVLSDGTQRFSRDLTMSIKRPAEAKAFVLLFWMLSWVLTHVAFGQVPLAISRSDPSSLDAHAAVVIAVLFVIPQLRKSMPDEPGLDGVLIDAIGYFPQMIITGFCALILLVLIVKREIASGEMGTDMTPPVPRSSARAELRKSWQFPPARSVHHRRRSTQNQEDGEKTPTAPRPMFAHGWRSVHLRGRSQLSVEIGKAEPFVIGEDDTICPDDTTRRSTESTRSQFSDITLSRPVSISKPNRF